MDKLVLDKMVFFCVNMLTCVVDICLASSLIICILCPIVVFDLRKTVDCFQTFMIDIPYNSFVNGQIMLSEDSKFHP